MKDKKIIAMLITSIVTFVASLSISLGVAFALADPVAAVGLTEVTYTISAESATHPIVFDPVGAYNQNIEDAVYIHNYDSIQYANEFLSDNVKLLKVSVNNDESLKNKFSFKLTLEGNEATQPFVKVFVFDTDTTNMQELTWKNSGAYMSTSEITLNANSVGHYIIATYVNTEFDFAGEASFGSSMTMNLTIVKY